MTEGLGRDDSQWLARAYGHELDPAASGIENQVLDWTEVFARTGRHYLVKQFARALGRCFRGIVGAEFGDSSLQLAGAVRILVASMLRALLCGEAELVKAAPVLRDGGRRSRQNVRGRLEKAGRGQRKQEAQAPGCGGVERDVSVRHDAVSVDVGVTPGAWRKSRLERLNRLQLSLCQSLLADVELA